MRSLLRDKNIRHAGITRDGNAVECASATPPPQAAGAQPAGRPAARPGLDRAPDGASCA
jgi:hypothetical protein